MLLVVQATVARKLCKQQTLDGACGGRTRWIQLREACKTTRPVFQSKVKGSTAQVLSFATHTEASTWHMQGQGRVQSQLSHPRMQVLGHEDHAKMAFCCRCKAPGDAIPMRSPATLVALRWIRSSLKNSMLNLQRERGTRCGNP